MLKIMKEGFYNRDILIGIPNLTLKNIICRNITCGKNNRFKKYKENTYICECGYLYYGEAEIEETHKVKLYCKQVPCIHGKTKMNKDCLKCEFIGER